MRFIEAWARLLSYFCALLDGVESGSREIEALLGEDGKRMRMARTIRGVSWSSWYTWPTAATVGFGGSVLLPLRFLQSSIDALGLGRALAKRGVWNVENAAGLRDFVAFPRLAVAAWRTSEAQLRAILAFQTTMNALVRAGAAGEDEALFKALRVDPSVLAVRPFHERLSAAVALNEKVFLNRVRSAIRNPVSLGQFDHPRLDATLWLMHRANALHRLTASGAYELFVVRTKLYPALGLEDSKRSLWTLVRRRRRELDTKAREKMSS